MNKKIALIAGLAMAMMSGGAIAGEAVKPDAKKINKGDVFASVSLFVSDIGMVTEKEMAAIKRNLFIEVLKADIEKNSKNKS